MRFVLATERPSNASQLMSRYSNIYMCELVCVLKCISLFKVTQPSWNVNITYKSLYIYIHIYDTILRGI